MYHARPLYSEMFVWTTQIKKLAPMTELIQMTGKEIIINLAGNKVCYSDLGKGNIPIIFIHGFPFDKSIWQPQMSALQKIYRVIAYDIRGFGSSNAGAEMNMNILADDLIKLMDGLSIPKAIVCGLSLGGYIVLNAISRYPDRFEAIVLADTQCIADTEAQKKGRNETIAKIKICGLRDFTEDLLKKLFCPASLKIKKELVENIRVMMLATSAITISQTLMAMANRNDMCASLKNISVPTLIICGKEDEITPTIQALNMKRNIPQSKLVIIDDAGHLPNLEQPMDFNLHLSDFVAHLPKPIVV